MTLVCPSQPPEWFPVRSRWHRTEGLEPDEIPSADVVVATFWTTLPKAVEADRGEVAHLCQGFEGDLRHNVDEHPAIHQAYLSPVPALAVSPHLAEMIRHRFDRPARVVPQLLEPGWRPRMRWRPGRPPRILATGPWEIYLKGVSVAANAVLELRRRGLECRWIRLSQWPLCDEEREHLEPDEFHHHLPPHQVPELVRSCDVLLAPSWPAEGFGLPALEAMACGVPTVVSDIPSFRGFATGASLLAPYQETAAFADAAESLLENPRHWRRRRRAGLEVAKGYRGRRALEQVEEALRWVASGRWRFEL